MDRKRECLQAYFAGIFDGEGSVGAYWYKNTYTLKASIAMDHPAAASLIWREYPEARLRKMDRVDRKPSYYVVAFNHYKAERFLKELLPYLIVKHEQAVLGLSFLAHRRRDHAHTKALNCHGRCDKFVERMKAAKRIDPNGVNSVNALLGHGLREYRSKRIDVEQDIALIGKHLSSFEGVETSGAASTANKPVSAPEKDIVHPELDLGLSTFQ